MERLEAEIYVAGRRVRLTAAPNADRSISAKSVLSCKLNSTKIRNRAAGRSTRARGAVVAIEVIQAEGPWRALRLLRFSRRRRGGVRRKLICSR